MRDEIVEIIKVHMDFNGAYKEEELADYFVSS